MALGNKLQQYSRTRPSPERKRVNVDLKNDIALTLDIPDFGVSQQLASHSLMSVLLSHAAFKSSLVPQAQFDDGFYEECTAEVNTINLFFPDIESDTIRICFTAWLAFICAVDDILEKMLPAEQESALLDCIHIINSDISHGLSIPPSTVGAKEAAIQGMARTFHSHCSRYLSVHSAQAFFRAITVVFEAHLDEIRFLAGHLSNDFTTYMGIRSRTIALSPFFEVIKSEYLPHDTFKGTTTMWDDLQHAVSCAAGLQNDLIGLARDLENGERLNAVMVLLPTLSDGDIQHTNRDALSQAVTLVAAEHNRSVSRAFECAGQVIMSSAEGLASESIVAVAQVARNILLLCETHLKWCASAKRYRVDDGGKPWIKTGRQHQSNMIPASPPPSEPDSLLGSHPEEGQQLVCSQGIFHGLPVYEPPARRMTAIVTGATGVSGYSMVKLLASSPNWERIYCLSSRPPPDNFFADLEEGAGRVEHLAVDFLSDPDVIAQALSRVPHVDHIFYFSYMQPAPKGDVLDLWANPDELATVNATMFTNFITALEQTPQLVPQRFLLQTGSKHYAFYLGPAANPAFESDPRVPLARNFYYEQEDALAAYCRRTSSLTSYTIARPSYIIGAVRDGTLNHLVGFGVYASVQAFLGLPLHFPGDYRAWDREQVQSSAELNARFEEWLALRPETAGEAFNIHDGQSFTWGRLWPALASWYGVDWTPPETDESKYRTVTLPYEKTPRGFSPQLTLRSTFSLLEWSLQPEVEQAWRTLAARHALVLDPFDDRYRARIFSFSDSAVIGDAPMTISVRKAREFGFFGTCDSYRSIYDSMRELARLKLIVGPQGGFEGDVVCGK
ncbi:Iridoid synthase [Echria macrotheca]|uniref:Iridoid synthase n=1 Tax=Echria macrotheca TaxID=438768 RepID=A0AAJ0B8T2_9PEZI|nr:Iridoid synthase [Echria macrotheca]